MWKVAIAIRELLSDTTQDALDISSAMGIDQLAIHDSKYLSVWTLRWFALDKAREEHRNRNVR